MSVNSFDGVLATPPVAAATLSLRTQQIIPDESGVVPDEDLPRLTALGVAGIFRAGATLESIAPFFRDLAQRAARQARGALPAHTHSTCRRSSRSVRSGAAGPS
jgi:hypothetical protein